MSKPSLLYILALVACTSILATPALANLLGGLGLLGGGLALPDVQQCLVGISGVKGCLHELIFSVLSLQPRLLGPACCEAFLQIDENCWPKVFPLNPSFAPLLKDFCAGTAPPPPPCYSDAVSTDTYEGGDCEDD